MNPTLAKAAFNLKRRARSDVPAIWMMSDEKRLPDPVAALAGLPRGAAVILRHYAARDRTAIAQHLGALCRRQALHLIIAGDWRLAASVNAHGLHLAEHTARRGPAPGARLWLRQKGRLLTTAAHGPRGLREARSLRASGALLSPVFKTASHPDRTPLTVTRVAAMTRAAKIPVIALGGVAGGNIARLRDSGCAGIAGISFAIR